MGPTCSRTICFESYQRGDKVIGKLPNNNWAEFSSRSEYETACIEMFGEMIQQCMEVLDAYS